jgi:hypothetical protein
MVHCTIALIAAASIGAASCESPGPAAAPEPSRSAERARVVAIGDIACGSPPGRTECRYDAVAEAVLDERPDLLLALGDVQYATESGRLDFRFYDRYFGSLRSDTLPTGGDEDWGVDRDAFLEYFGSRASPRGYDSILVAGWQIIALNSPDCFDNDGCKEGSEQIEWLRTELAARPSECTLAIWHDPRFLWAKWWTKDGVPRAGQERVAPFWTVLAESNAEVVLHGNAHHYERWAPMDASGGASDDGITEFVVGTGGKSLNPLGVEPRPANLEIAQAEEFGALVLDLEPGRLSYRWRGVDRDGSFEDVGTIRCH